MVHFTCSISYLEEKQKLLVHRNVVTFVDSQVTQNPADGTYTVMIAMEYCSGGGLLDMMNKRINNRFTEQEVLAIFSDIVEAVAYLHYQQPHAITHRDLKVENVLISRSQQGQVVFKLCDFGSCTRVSMPTGTNLSPQDVQLLQEELDRLTTLAYRAPEMCDLYKIRRQGLGTKCDIWALGVLLYKLCFYTVPFAEEDGKLAILNNRYTIPDHHPYSTNLVSIIRACLTANAQQRPDAYRLMTAVCKLRGAQCPIGPSPHQEIIMIDKELPQAPSNLPQMQYIEPEQAVNARRGRIRHGATPSTSSATVDPSLFQGVQVISQSDVFAQQNDAFGQIVAAEAMSSQPSSAVFDDVFGQAPASQENLTVGSSTPRVSAPQQPASGFFAAVDQTPQSHALVSEEAYIEQQTQFWQQQSLEQSDGVVVSLQQSVAQAAQYEVHQQPAFQGATLEQVQPPMITNTSSQLQQYQEAAYEQQSAATIEQHAMATSDTVLPDLNVFEPKVVRPVSAPHVPELTLISTQPEIMMQVVQSAPMTPHKDLEGLTADLFTMPAVDVLPLRQPQMYAQVPPSKKHQQSSSMPNYNPVMRQQGVYGSQQARMAQPLYTQSSQLSRMAQQPVISQQSVFDKNYAKNLVQQQSQKRPDLFSDLLPPGTRKQ